MATLFKVDEWSGAGNRWHVADTTIKTTWAFIPKRVLNITPAEFVRLLVEEYSASIDYYNNETGLLLYSWAAGKYEKAHAFKLYICRIARNKGIMI